MRMLKLCAQEDPVEKEADASKKVLHHSFIMTPRLPSGRLLFLPAESNQVLKPKVSRRRQITGYLDRDSLAGQPFEVGVARRSGWTER